LCAIAAGFNEEWRERPATQLALALPAHLLLLLRVLPS